MNYRVIVCEDREKLAAIVEERLAEGWQLAGGVAMAPEERWDNDSEATVNVVIFAQAIILP